MVRGILALPGIFQSISEDGYCFNSAFYRWTSPGGRQFGSNFVAMNGKAPAGVIP
jgi:hypothetical protein